MSFSLYNRFRQLEKVRVDKDALEGYLGATNADGVLRTGSNLTYIDGGNYITLNLVATPTFANLIIADAGYIGSVSDTDAIQIEADGDIVMSQDLAITGTLGCGGPLTITQNSDTLVLSHDGENAYVKWSDGDLALMTDEADTDTVVSILGKGTGVGVLEVYDTDETSHIILGWKGDNQPTITTNATPSEFSLLHDRVVDIKCWSSIGSGNPYFYIYGHGTAANEYLRMRVESDNDALIEAEHDLNIIAGGGTISFGDENLVTTGTLNVGSDTLSVNEVAGKVGIATASPQQILHISHNTPVIRLSDMDADDDQDVTGVIEFYRGNNTNRVGYLAMTSYTNDILAIATEYPDGEICLKTGSAAAALTIDKYGRVGIGATSPSDLLEVNGGNIRLWNSGGDPIFYIGASAGGGDYGYIYWDSSEGNLILSTQAGGDTLIIKESGDTAVTGTFTASSMSASNIIEGQVFS